MLFRSVFLTTPLVALTSGSVLAVEIIAHRGASRDAPENTLPAFRLAWDQKADACELDVHLTRDGRIAVIHDDTTQRTAGLNRKVAEQTFEELRELDVGAWKGLQWQAERIPSLEEVLAGVPDGKRMFIEIKCGPEILPELVRVIGGAPCKPDQLVIIGFGYETMKQAKELLPHIDVYWGAKPKEDSNGSKLTAETLIEKASAAGLDGLDLDAGFAIDADFVERIHAANLKLFVWTVDAPAKAERLRSAGVDGITTNRPGFLREQFAE